MLCNICPTMSQRILDDDLTGIDGTCSNRYGSQEGFLELP